jgi:hypothetical protein
VQHYAWNGEQFILLVAAAPSFSRPQCLANGKWLARQGKSATHHDNFRTITV